MLRAPAVKKLALAAAAALALVCAAEGGLRFARVGAPTWYEPDPQAGWRLRANAQGYQGRAYARINGMGQRDLDYTVDKPNGVYRIAVLGDGYSEAFGVPIRRTWWGQLERNLQRCGFEAAKRIEVLNFGVGGYGTAQELVVLETAAMRYQPDLVLLQFANRDDVVDNSFALAPDKDRPFFMLDPRGQPRLDDSFSTSPTFEARSQFRYRMLAELTDRSRLVQLALPRWPDRRSDDPAALAAPRGEIWEDAWRITEALIGRMNAYAARNGARFAVVTIPAARQLADGADYPDRRLAAFGAKQGIPVITLAGAMRGAQDRFYSPSGEWNEAGHDAAAALVARGLCGPAPAGASVY